MGEQKHNLYVIAGCNGAGKTTASFTVLPEMLDCREFVNADEIAAGLSPFNPEGVAIQAGRLMIERIIHLLKEGETFAFETHQTGTEKRLFRHAALLFAEQSGTGRETGGQTRKRRWTQHPARCDLPPLRQRPE